MFKLIGLLRDLWQLRAENSALRSRISQLERQGNRPAPASTPKGPVRDPPLAQQLEQVSGELQKAQARLERVRAVIFRVRRTERGVEHV